MVSAGMRSVLVALVIAWAVLAGCRSSDDSSRGEDGFDAMPRRHVFAPPPGEVRAVPPHAIRSAGVGPYLLGASLEEILSLLPHGPRVELLQIQELLDYSLVRIDADAIVIGVERFEGVTFVAVLDPDVARAEAGAGVGTSRAELLDVLGPEAENPDLARDPRMLGFPSLPSTQFVLERDEVVAVIVRDSPAPEPPEEGARCAGDAWAEVDVAAIADAARVPARDRGSIQLALGCADRERARLAVTAGERLTVVTGDPEAPRRRGSVALDGLVYAAWLDITGDGRDELVAVASRHEADVLSIEVSVVEVTEDGLVIEDRTTPYELSSRWATWVGAELEGTELLIELRVAGGAVSLSGLFLHRDGEVVRNIAPLKARTWAPELVPPQPAAPADGDRDAGASPTEDAGALPPDGAAPEAADAGERP